MNEFQKEAFEAFKKQTLGENGEMDELSFRRGIEFLSELSNFSNIEVEKGKFDWLDTKEKEMLLKQMPAVHGIIGSIFVEQFFRAGYEFGFNADNTVIVKPKNAGQQTKARELQTQLNNQIARNPHLANSLKAGLLYNNQDLLTYLRMNATSDGKEISEDAQKPENFIKFLEGRNTDSAKAILASRNFFKDLNWEGHLHAASYVPNFSKELSVIMSDPQAQQAITQNFTQNQSAPNGTQVLFNTMTAPDDSLNKPLPTLEENIDKHGYAGGILTHTGMLWGRGFKTLFSSPEAGTLTIAAMIILPFVVGFKNAMGIFAGTPLALGLIDNFTNDKKPEEGSPEEENDPPTTSADQMGIKDLVPEKRRALIESTYPKEEVEPMIKATATLQTEKVGHLRDYIGGNADAKISDNAKQSLETENNKELVKKHIETLRNKEIELAKQSGQLTEEGLKVYTQLLDDMRLSQLEWYSVSSIEERTKTINAYMQKKSEPNTSKNSDSSNDAKKQQSS